MTNKHLSTPIFEEEWDLPQDFNLFSTHEVRTIHFPKIKGNNHPNFLQIECLEPSSPLDIMNTSTSEHQYDATGHCVWAGALLLVACIHDPLIVKCTTNGQRMVELGCGTGIGGLAMMLACKDAGPDTVCFTDYDPAALKVCQRNCSLNKLSRESYSVCRFTWGEGNAADAIGMFDVALATDVLYDVDLCSPLFSTVSQCLSLDGTFILSHVPRACYNEGNPPEAIENLEQYIINIARDYGLSLRKVIRPPCKNETVQEEFSLPFSERIFPVDSGVMIFHKADLI